MRTREDCTWCMSIKDKPHRPAQAPLPPEMSGRCGACQEQWLETHAECDACCKMINTEEVIIHHDIPTNMYICNDCKDKHGFI